MNPQIPFSAIPTFRPHGSQTTPANYEPPSVSIEAHGNGNALVQVINGLIRKEIKKPKSAKGIAWKLIVAHFWIVLIAVERK